MYYKIVIKDQKNLDLEQGFPFPIENFDVP